MAILPELTGGQFLQAFERRSVPVYQGCIALERDTNVISVGPVDTINPSDCANVCATHGSRDVGINAQFCVCFSSTPTIAKLYNPSACSWPCDSPYGDYSCGGMEIDSLVNLYSYYVAQDVTVAVSSSSIASDDNAESTSTVGKSTANQNFDASPPVDEPSSASSPPTASIYTGTRGPMMTTVTCPVWEYFEIPLSTWVGVQDTVFYSIESFDAVLPPVVPFQKQDWIALNPVFPASLYGFTFGFLARTTWSVHLTVQHTDSTSSIFQIKIVVAGRLITAPPSRTGDDYPAVPGMLVLRGTGPGPESTTTAITTTATTTATTNSSIPIDEIKHLVPGHPFNIALSRYFRHSGTDQVVSCAVVASLSGYDTDWILYNADNSTLYGTVPDDSPSVALLITVAAGPASQGGIRFSGIKLMVNEKGQRGVVSPPIFSGMVGVESSTDATATATTKSIPRYTPSLWTTKTEHHASCPPSTASFSSVSAMTGMMTQVPGELFTSSYGVTATSTVDDQSTTTAVATSQTAVGYHTWESCLSEGGTETPSVDVSVTDRVTGSTKTSTTGESGTTGMPTGGSGPTKSRSVTVVTSTIMADVAHGMGAAGMIDVSFRTLLLVSFGAILGVHLLL